MSFIRDLARQIFRFLVVWVIDALSLLLTAFLVPGIFFAGGRDVLVVAAAAAFLLGIVSFLIRPIILLLALPFGFIAIFIVSLFLNAIALLITAQLLVGFHINSWWEAFIGSLILALSNTILSSIIAVDNDDSFYQNMAERIAKRQEFFPLQENSQGIIMLEIDGLSYHHIKKAIAGGWMPTLKRMQDEEDYVLSRFDCGLPSQTSACQAGIMFGDNFDIPAFRWYDKDLQRLIVSGRDAAMINSRFAKGAGLMREGSSVNNMLNGDARVSVLTLADLFQASEEQQLRRAEDFYLVLLDPYFLLRTLVLYVGDVIRELYEGIRQQLRKQVPRLNRLAHFYPLIRAATTVLMRDVSSALAILDVVRGTPAMYVTWPGYDEVAHHSGPWTTDAFHTLRQYDHVIRRIRDTIANKAPRPYELIILSDHGQSYGWTFKQRYGESLKDFIEKHMPSGTNVSQSAGGDDGMISVSAMASELDNMQQKKMGGRISRGVMRGARRAVDRGMREQERAQQSTTSVPSRAASTLPPASPAVRPSDDSTTKPSNHQTTEPPDHPTAIPFIAPPDQPTNVTVCGSGNLAQIYFNLAARRLTLEELNQAYPGVIDALVQHEGIGIVMAYNEQQEPLVFGKKGGRNLTTNQIIGEDPLTMYGDANLRAAQLKRLAEFPHNGDLSVISTFYPDGTVAAMEELVGNHGGLGGEQTDAFLFHPNAFEIPETSNSADVFHILNARRGAVVVQEAKPVPREIDAWNPPVLMQGLMRVRRWASVALRALLLDRWAYRQAAFSPYMTSPALLIALVAQLVVSVTTLGTFDIVDWLWRFGTWFVSVLFLFAAARLLRGKADFTTTLRASGFAQMGYFIELLTLIPPLATTARIAAIAVTFLGTWLGVSEAHHLRGWRTFLLPFAAIAIGIASILILNILLRGTEMTLDNLSRGLGLTPR